MSHDIAAVTLDAAGTVIGIRHPVGNTYARIAGQHGIHLDVDRLGRAFRDAFASMPPLAFAAQPRHALEHEERTWWRTLVRRCVGPAARDPSFDSFFDDLYAYYRRAEAWMLYPDVLQVLDALDAARLPVAVVSNFDSRLHDILRGLGVHSRFTSVVCSSEAGAAKPDHRIFEIGCHELGAAPHSVLHTGDDRRADLEGATAAGLRGLWLRREGAGEPGDDEVTTLHGILERLPR